MTKENNKKETLNNTVEIKKILISLLESFTTLEQVRKAWSEANEISRQAHAETIHALPSGQPDNLDIFEETGNNSISSSLERFETEELYLDQTDLMLMRSAGCEVLVSVDKRENGECHICLTQDSVMKDAGGLALNPHIEALATALYKRAYVAQASEQPKQEEQSPSSGGILTAAKGLLTKLANPFLSSKTPEFDIDPKTFHFYVYKPPEDMTPSMFSRVDMTFAENNSHGEYEFQDPQFEHYNVVPEAIKQAFIDSKTPEADFIVNNGQAALPQTTTEEYDEFRK